MKDATLLLAKGIGKSFPGVKALNNVNLNLRKGEVHAILGENGAGKSTLMKIISGAISFDEGELLYKGKPLLVSHPKQAQELGISIVYQEFNLLPELTVAENIYINREPRSKFNKFLIDDNKMNEDAKNILKKLNSKINPKEKVENLSVAQQQMVEIAKALSFNCELLIMDEPTAALTESETDVLFEIINRLKKNGVAIAFISHRLEELHNIVDRVTILRDGEFISEYLFRDKTLDEIVQDMVGRKLTSKYPEKPNYKRGEKILEVRNLNRKGILHNINFSAYKGEILGIAGLMGSGRTELARAIFGADPIDSGEILLSGNVVKIKSPEQAIKLGIGYITEDRKKNGLALSLNIRENVILSSHKEFSNPLGFIKQKQALNIANQYIDNLKIRTYGSDQLTRNLSGGNQQKVVLAKWLCKNTKILIFDEPTRGIDIGAKYEIYQLMYQLIENGITIIMISSELPEVLGMSDRILIMNEGSITGELLRNEATQEKIIKYAIN